MRIAVGCLFACVLFSPIRLFSEEATVDPQTSTSNHANGYVFPTNQELRRYWLESTLGLRGLVGSGLRASWNTWVDQSPVEWSQDASGWGRRFGTSLLDNGLNQSTLVLLSLATHQDPRYYRCSCSGFGPRLGHSVKLAFFSRKPSGDYVFSAPKIVSGFPGPMVTRNTIYPDRFNSGDAAISGLTYFGGSIGWNVIKEFIWKHR